MLPETVDWRGSGADSEVKDQAMCGSCWAFAAIAPMEAAYYRAYGAAPSCCAFLPICELLELFSVYLCVCFSTSVYVLLPTG